MAKVYDVVAAAGEYTDRDGNTKVRWINCGAVFETEKGLSLKLDAYAVGEGWYKLFEPKKRGGGQVSPQAPNPPAQDPDDDIPF